MTQLKIGGYLLPIRRGPPPGYRIATAVYLAAMALYSRKFGSFDVLFETQGTVDQEARTVTFNVTVTRGADGLSRTFQVTEHDEDTSLDAVADHALEGFYRILYG